jgi:uncharacterized damage-inducible protein DinB
LTEPQARSVWLEADVAIPWIEFRPSARQALLQVLTHSAQHRPQLAMQLERLGVEVPNFDYITMVVQQVSGR